MERQGHAKSDQLISSSPLFQNQNNSLKQPLQSFTLGYVELLLFSIYFFVSPKSSKQRGSTVFQEFWILLSQLKSQIFHFCTIHREYYMAMWRYKISRPLSVDFLTFPMITEDHQRQPTKIGRYFDHTPTDLIQLRVKNDTKYNITQLLIKTILSRGIAFSLI